MIFGKSGTALMAPTKVEDNHTAAVAPATYVITVDLFSVSSHLSAIVFNTSSELNFSARMDTSRVDTRPEIIAGRAVVGRTAAARAAVSARRATTTKTAMISGRVSARNVSMRAEKFNSDDVLKTIADKWEETENKSTVITYVAGATAAVWLSSTLVGAINAVPLLPKIMELVGLGYSTWFVYRYVLFKDSRKELVEQVDALVSRVSGEE